MNISHERADAVDPHALRRWFAETPGRFLVAQEQACLEQLLPGLFGYHLVQIGHIDAVTDSLALSPIRNHVLIDRVAVGPAAVNPVRSDPGCLPLATDSIDAVVLPHALDFARDPHQVLREIERVLIPEGQVVILGFNPWSLWGLWRMLHHLWAGHEVPWSGRFLAPRRLQDWLSLLGFELEATRYFMFSPPLACPGIMDRFGFLERLGGQWWPLMGGAYMIHAVKRVSTLTPLEPGWKKARAKIRQAGAIEPTARNTNGR